MKLPIIAGFGIALFMACGVIAVPSLTLADTCNANSILINDAGEPVLDSSGVATNCTPEAGSAAASSQFSRSGIFGCNQTAAYRMSVGALSAVGGVYVPVNDAAVTLNTGYLVYKECVLDGVTKRMVESATSAYNQFGLKGFLTGKDGGAYYPQDLTQDTIARRDKAVLYTLESGELSTIKPEFKGVVEPAAARSYMASRAPNKALECPYKGDSRTDIWGGLTAITNPACTLMGAFHLTNNYILNKAAEAEGEMMFRLMTGQGIYGVEEFDPATGRYRTLTPSSIVAANVQQLVTSGYRQLENASEIDQIVGALFSGLATHIMTDNKGLAGLTQSVAGQPSYLDQVARESAQGLRDSAVNAAIQILSGARQIEAMYLNAMNAIATSLTQTITQLRVAENRCWDLVVPTAQEYASQNNFQINVATSTAFSKQVIDSQIAPLATITVTNVQNSERAMTLIEQLIAGVTNTTSVEAQRVALQQLDSLVAQGALHTQYDAQQATQRKDEVVGAMATLIEDTVLAWGDSPDPAVGWCNINNPDIARTWAEKWRR